MFVLLIVRDVALPGAERKDGATKKVKALGKQYARLEPAREVCACRRTPANPSTPDVRPHRAVGDLVSADHRRRRRPPISL